MSLRRITTTGQRFLPAGIWLVAFASTWLAGFGLLLAIPGPLEGKALAVLHGLCAQQPSHSFYFGEARLPFDARMTGIYGGFAIAGLTLLARGRWRAGGVPPWPIALSLALFVILLGIDGSNSTLRDLGVWHPYPPHNALRLLTGLLAGATLAVFLWLMLAQVGFAHSARSPRPAVRDIRDLGDVLVALSLFGTLVLSGWPVLWLPLTLLLVAAAVAALLGLILAFVLLLGGREARATTTHELLPSATLALVIALLVIGSLAGGRFVLETLVGIPTNGLV
jgi:uncharacterized membrane protein